MRTIPLPSDLNDELREWRREAPIVPVGWMFPAQMNGGAGRLLKGLVTLETTTRFRADVDAAIRAIGPCLVRTVAGDERRRLYVFRCSPSGADETIYSPNVHVTVRRRGVVVLSGTDEDGRTYEWNREVLTVRVAELAAFEAHDGRRLQHVLERLPPTDYTNAAPAPKRRKA